MADEPTLSKQRQIELAKRIADLKAEASKDRWTPYIFLALSAGLVALAIYTRQANQSILEQLLLWAIAVVAAIASFGMQSDKSEKRAELERANAELALLIKLDQGDAQSSSRDEDYFKNLVTINVSNLKEYYFLVKSHTRSSFQTAITAGALGFGLVVTGLVAGFTAKTPEFTRVAAGSGILMQFISGVFFYLYNRTVRQLKEYHDSLLDVQDVLLALKVLEGVSDPATKSEIVRAVVVNLMEGSARKLRTPRMASAPKPSAG